MDTLDGRVAVITGGASGIGLALADALGAEGMKLVLADIEQGALDRAVADLSGRGLEVVGVRTDVADFASMQALAQATLAAFGKVHLICNNAGVSITGPLWELSMDDWRWVYDVNTWGVIHGIKAFVPILIEQGEPGHVITTASLASFGPTGEHAPYCSSKAAAWSITQALYSELRAWDTPIGVTLVCPGMVDTQIHRSWRNRPEGDRPWSDRESADPEHMKGSEVFQGRGIPASEVAAATVAAVKENRFFVFTGEHWSDFMANRVQGLASGANPPVVTWGRDLRPKANA